MIEKAHRFAIFCCLGFVLTSVTLFASDPIQVREWIEQLRHPSVGSALVESMRLFATDL